MQKKDDDDDDDDDEVQIAPHQRSYMMRAEAAGEKDQKYLGAVSGSSASKLFQAEAAKSKTKTLQQVDIA